MLTKSDIPLHICYLTSQTHISVEEIIFRDKISWDFSRKNRFANTDFPFWEGSPRDPGDSKIVNLSVKHFFLQKTQFFNLEGNTKLFVGFPGVPRGRF